MGLSGVLEAAIGLVLIYFLVSMFCSGINEFIANELGRRGKFLREGMINVIGDRWIYLRLINHPLVSSLYRDVPGKPKTPSYVPAGNVASALLDVVLFKAGQLDPKLDTRDQQPWTFESVRAAALKCRQNGYTVADALLPLLDSAHGSLDQAHANIAAWYESGMDRVSGWYKKYTRRLLLLIGVIAAVLFNVDTLEIVTELAKSSALRKTLADAATEVVEAERAQASAPSAEVAPEDLRRLAAQLAAYEKRGVPLGFSCLHPEKMHEGAGGLRSVLDACWEQTKSESAGNWLLKILGWLITGLAVSLGAPFWFDLLNKLVDLRGAGKKPQPAAKPVS